jgi:hypothetical protein
LTFEPLKTAFSSSPKLVHEPSVPTGTGAAEILSPSASSISFALPMWWIVMAVFPDFMFAMISLKRGRGRRRADLVLEVQVDEPFVGRDRLGFAKAGVPEGRRIGRRWRERKCPTNRGRP